MRRTAIELPDDLYALLRREAERRGVTVSEIAREAVESCLGGRRRQLGAAGTGRSGRTDTSEKIEEMLSGGAVG